MRLAAAAAAILVLSACAHSYESRIRDNLVSAGFSSSMAGCTADRLVDRLSDRQLRSLARLGRASNRSVGDMTVDQILDEFRGAVDAEIYAELSRAALSCALAR